jgi:hypothetical protein
MEQPKIRIAPLRDLTDMSGFIYAPVVKAISVTISGEDTDVPVLRVDAGTYVEVIQRVKTALDGTTPTADLGTSADEDALMDNTEIAQATANAVARCASGLFFAADGVITIDTASGDTDLTDGELELIFVLYNFDNMFLTPHDDSVEVTTPA